MTALEFYNNFDKMTPVLNSFAYNLTKSIEDAKDLYQETAFRAMTNRENNVAISNKAGSNIMVAELKGMIRDLDESIKVPFMMHYSGYKYQEIADYLELPLGTVKSRIFFARKELKNLIEKRYDDVNELRRQTA